VHRAVAHGVRSGPTAELSQAPSSRWTGWPTAIASTPICCLELRARDPGHRGVARVPDVVALANPYAARRWRPGSAC
jgi:hypothetical protein